MFPTQQQTPMPAMNNAQAPFNASNNFSGSFHPGTGRGLGLQGAAAFVNANPNPVANAPSPTFAKADMAGMQQAMGKVGGDNLRKALLRSELVTKEAGCVTEDASQSTKSVIQQAWYDTFARGLCSEAPYPALGGSVVPHSTKQASVAHYSGENTRITCTGTRTGMSTPGNTPGNFATNSTTNRGTSTGGNTLFSARHSGSLLHSGENAGFSKMAQAVKKASQDNNAEQRSAVGESKGLRFAYNDDNHLTGQAAWDATGKYFKGGAKLTSQPDPMQGKHRGTEKSAALGALGGFEKLAITLAGMTPADRFVSQQQATMQQMQAPPAAPPGAPPMGGMPPQGQPQPGMPPAAPPQPGMPPQGQPPLASGGMLPPDMPPGAMPPQASPVPGPDSANRMAQVGALAGQPDIGMEGDLANEMVMKQAGFNDYQLGFFTHCLKEGLTFEQTKIAVDQAHEKFGADASTELYSGLEKLAFGQAFKTFGKAVSQYGDDALQWGKGLFNKAPKAVPGVMPTASVPKAPLGGFGHMAGGAMTGGNMAESNNDSWYDNMAGAAAGAAFGRAMPRMSNGFQSAGRRAFVGNAAGHTAGFAGEVSGALPEGSGARMGQMGAWGGFGSAAVPGLKAPAPGMASQQAPWMRQAGKMTDDFLTGSNIWNPKQIASGLRNSSAATKAGLVAGPVALAGWAGGQTLGAFNDHTQIQAAKGVQQFMQSPEFSQGINDKMKQELGIDMAEAKQLLASGKQGAGMLSQFANFPDMVLGMFMSPEQLAGMNPMMKWMMLLGGGSLLGGALTGSGAMTGLGVAGLGGAALMGGFPGLTGGSGGSQGAPDGYSPPGGPEGGAMAPGMRSGGPQTQPNQPQARNELQYQQQLMRRDPMIPLSYQQRATA